MANKGHPPSSERSKVRVVMVEFEGPSGDLHQLTQTLANAVRPQPIIMPAAPTPALPVPAAPPTNGTGPDLFHNVSADDLTPEVAVERVTAPKAGNGAKRKSKVPAVIENIDFTGEPQPFKQFMAELNVEDYGRRYLGITQWFKEHRQTPEIGADHIYTCYRFLSLPVPEDLTVAFRKLKAAGAVANGSKRGLYRITHIGENQLTEARKKE